jgi:hypothetical protein
MLGCLIAALVACGVWISSEMKAGHPVPLAPVAIGLPLLLGLLGVILQMISHPQGIRDWVQGGVIDVTSTSAGRVRWIDWAIAFTRQGSLDPAAGYVKLERRLLFGLIPVGSVLRPLRDFYRVEVQTEPRYRRRGRRGFAGDYSDHHLVGYSYAVFLVDRSGDRLCVADLDAGTGRAAEQFIGNLRQQLEAAVGRPGEAPRLASPGQELLPDDGRGDDFAAWRKKKQEGA